jgi:hypothetical protein
MALWAVAFLGLRPFASLLDGTLASLFGVRVAGVVLAVPALVAALALLAAPRLAHRGPAWMAGAAGVAGRRDRATGTAARVEERV